MKDDNSGGREGDAECRIALKCSQTLRAKLDAAAKSKGSSVSAIIREIILPSLKRHRPATKVKGRGPRNEDPDASEPKKGVNEHLRVLLVEDNLQCAEAMCDMIRHAGFELIHERVQDAPSMRSAMLSQRWDVIISDNHMPQFSGRDSLRIAKELAPTVPVIHVTSHPSQGALTELKSAGACACHDKADFHKVTDLLRQRFLPAESEV